MNPVNLTKPSVGWVVGSVGSRGLTPAALVEPIAVAVHLEDVDVMGDAVEQRPGQAARTRTPRSFVDRQVGGD